jgi:hypothetical protein
MSSLPLRQSRITYVLLIGLASVALTGCPGDLDPRLQGGGTAGTGGPAACDAPAMVFDSKPNALCASVGCHDPMFKQGGLDLTNDAQLVSRLLGVMSDGSNGSRCGNGVSTEPYLVPGSNPAMGLLLDKMFVKPAPCGDPMPSIGTLTQQNMDCIKSWALSVTSP